jgi:two-component system NtrC family sensor kinase
LVNKAARDVFAIAEETPLMGQPFLALFHQPELVELANAPDDSLSNRSEISPDGNRAFAVQVTPIAGVGRVFTLNDITYLKKLDRIKTDFVQTVSHDLRSPLTAILGYAELIERAGPVSDLQRDFVRRIQTSVRNITSLVDDLLDLGRVESGFDLRKESVSLEQIIRYSSEGFKKSLAERHMLLQIDLPADFPSIIANPVQMRQMAEHLIDNAIKYSHPGGVINVGGRVEQNQIILQFSDAGIGIPALDLPYIFDKFYRAVNASLDIHGTGLGLSIVKSIVENHDGRIWVDSTAGKGTSFTVVLPFERDMRASYGDS